VLITLLALAVVLGVLIFVHEAGHFLAAKWAGIYVHRFSLGLGPPIKALTFRRGETEYSISWLPLGGYVKMASREEDAATAALEGGHSAAPVPPDRMFEAKPVWKRMVVILAGVTMNLLFAWLVFVVLAAKNGRPVDPVTTVGRVEADSALPADVRAALGAIQPGDRIVAVGDQPVHGWEEVEQGIANVPQREVVLKLADGRTVTLPIHPDAFADRLRASQALVPFRAAVVGRVLAGHPAERAGIQPGDTVVGAGGRPVNQWQDLLDVLERSAGTPLALEVAGPGGRRTLTVTPEPSSAEDATGKVRRVGKIGVALELGARSVPYSLGGAIKAGTESTIESVRQIVRTVRGLFSGRVSRRELGGPIMIGQMAGQTARLGLDTFVAFMAFISVNLAVLNLLPIPVLDGGQFLFLLAEAVIRRPLPPKVRERLMEVGIVLVVLLMGLAFSNDIRRLFGA
jgi:regulator of sigma E protease